MDRERADFWRTLESLGKRLRAKLVPLQIPVGAESSFKGVADLMKMKAVLGTDGRSQETDIPEDLAE